MNTTYSKNNRLIFAVLAVILAFATIAIATGQSVQAEKTDDSDIDKLYEALDAQYDAILEKYGYVTPELTEKQEKALEVELALLDEKYWELEQEYEALDAQYDAILEKYGYVTPELTYEEELRLEAEITPLDEQYWELEDDFEHYEISPELEAKYEELDKQYYVLLEKFGFSFPELTEDQEIALEKRFAPLDEQYEKIYAEMENNDLTEQQEQGFESELEILDSKYNKILQEFGIVEPELTEEQERELEELLESLEDQYESLEQEFESDFEEDDH